MSCAREREIVRGEREREVWGEGRLTGGAHKGKGGGGSNRRVHGARGGGGGGGEAGPPTRCKKEREGKVVAGPRAWLGRAPGRAARRGEGREGKRGVFPFLIYLLNV
jgi:hypothetical protein